jgi:hypothetical protein
VAWQVVLARLDDDFIVVDPGQPDIGRRAKLQDVKKPVSLMWCRKGEQVDIAKAQRYAASEGYTVFTYPTNERDPLGRAKVDIANATDCSICRGHHGREITHACE